MTVLTEDQVLLRNSVERYLDNHYSFESRHGIVASDAGYSPAIWAAFAEMGLLALPFPEEMGGIGDPMNTLVVMEAFGRSLVVEPFLPTVILAGGLLRHGGTAAQRERFIPAIIAGKSLWAVAFAEPQSRYNLHNVATTAIPDGEGFRISGEKIAVLGGPMADRLIVAARTSGETCDEQGITLFIVDAAAQGVRRVDYRTVDGGRAANISLDDVLVGPEAVMGVAGDGTALLTKVVDEAIAALCAQATGVITVLNEKVIAHCRTRIMFDQPLSRSQVVQHRLVDMRVAEAHARAITLRAFQELDQPAERRMAAVSSAKAQLAKEAALVAKEAVQLHGAMGITDELDISHYFRWVTVFGGAFGDRDHHVRRVMACSTNAPMTEAAALDAATEIDELTPEEIAFRDEMRAFFADNMTDELRRVSAMTMWHTTDFRYSRGWQQTLDRHGYGAPGWPVKHGGRDWTAAQRLIWVAEYVRAHAPHIMSMGLSLVAPCIMEFGTSEQQAMFLPRILSGEDWWAQGYSEPGAGSDLASLKMSAVSDGDDYILNGSKIWTTQAHNCNRMFCLVRTSSEGRKQAGITFLLLDMDTPGIEVRPIINMAGDHEFNQVFFTDVRVPKARRLGQENEGWKIARHLLLFEHGAHLLRVNVENIRRLGWIRELASQEGDGNGGRLLDDSGFARQIAELDIEVRASDAASRGQLALAKSGAAPDSSQPLLSVRTREIAQSLTELAMQAVAYHGIVFQPEARRAESATPVIGPEHALLPMPFYLTQRGFTIAGGVPEVHRNNLARGVLHL